MFIARIIYLVLWLAFVAGVGEVLVDFTKEMRGTAIAAHRRGMPVPFDNYFATETSLNLTDSRIVNY